MREWLTIIRKQQKLSQYDMADLTGLSQSYYAAIETGQRGKPLAVPVAKKIARVLGFDWQRFYTDADA